MNGRGNGFAGHEDHDDADRVAWKKMQAEAEERFDNWEANRELFREIFMTRIHDPAKLHAAKRSPSG